MKITAIRTGEISIPLARPFKTALRTVEPVEDIVVCITAENGMVGYGEAPPTAVITGDTKGSILSAINQFIAPAILGADLEHHKPAPKNHTERKPFQGTSPPPFWAPIFWPWTR